MAISTCHSEFSSPDSGAEIPPRDLAANRDIFYGMSQLVARNGSFFHAGRRATNIPQLHRYSLNLQDQNRSDDMAVRL